MKTELSLTQVPRELAKIATEKRHIPTYGQVYRAVIDGVIPAKQGANGRYLVDPDLTPIMQHFGLTRA